MSFIKNKYIKNFITLVIVLAFGLMTVNFSFVEANEKNQYSLSEEELLEASIRARDIVSMSSTTDDILFDEELLSSFDDLSSLYQQNLPFIAKDDVTDEAEEIEDDISEELEEDSENVEDEFEETEEILEADLSDWRLILVNKQNPVPDDYSVKLSNINGSQMADERIIEDIYKMLEAAREDNVDLLICSSYRSFDRQTSLFNNKMNKLMASGMSYLEAYTVGSMSVTVPGTSEHQLGLALDILTSGYLSMDDGFGETKAGIWLSENAPKYGFILRYPKGKEAITGIIYEPWHFRYVGSDYAKQITELGISLEEYINGEY